jgi:hypothetical protein
VKNDIGSRWIVAAMPVPALTPSHVVPEQADAVTRTDVQTQDPAWL